MTSLIRSMLPRQELHISQDPKERVFIGPQQGKIKILTQHLSQSCTCNLSLHLCAFQTISFSLKDFTDTCQVVFKQLDLGFCPGCSQKQIHTMTEIWSGKKLFGVCDLLHLLFIFNIHLHLQKLLVQDLCKRRVKGGCFFKRKDWKSIEAQCEISQCSKDSTWGTSEQLK